MPNLMSEKSELILSDTSSASDRFGWVEYERGLPLWLLDREAALERLEASLGRIAAAGKREPYPTEVERLRGEYRRMRTLLREGERELDMQLVCASTVLPEDVDVWESPTLGAEVSEQVLSCSTWTDVQLVNWVEGLDLIQGEIPLPVYLMAQLLCHRELVSRQGHTGVMVRGTVQKCTKPVHDGWTVELARLEKACAKLSFTKSSDLVGAADLTVVAPEGESYFGSVGLDEDEMIEALDTLRRFERVSARTGISTVELARAEALAREEE